MKKRRVRVKENEHGKMHFLPGRGKEDAGQNHP
jgi:hypothetical protein